MEIEPDRWPEPIRRFIDKQAENAENLLVHVVWRKPVWQVTLQCPCCKIGQRWAIVGPAPADAAEPLPVPSAFRELFADS